MQVRVKRVTRNSIRLMRLFQTGTYNGYNNFSPNHFGNPDLKWETVTSVDIGVDFAILKNRVWGFIDYFDKTTKDPILDFVISQPTAGSGTIYKNMDGVQAQKATVTNKGFEISVGAAIIEKKDLIWNAMINWTFVKNKFISDALAGCSVREEYRCITRPGIIRCLFRSHCTWPANRCILPSAILWI